MAWDGGDGPMAQQGYVLTVHVWIVNGDVQLEDKGPQMLSESSFEFNNYIQ